MKSLVGCIDASGNFDSKDRFFGVGLLVVEDVGVLTDKLHNIFQRLYALAQSQRDQRVEHLVQSGNAEEAVQMLRKAKRFEMKYEHITSTKEALYKEAVDVFLSNPNNRFTCAVIDRHAVGYNDGKFANSWEAYIGFVAMLAHRELRNLSDKELFLVADEVSKPRNAPLSLEDAIVQKVAYRCQYDKTGVPLGTLSGAVRIESHSNLLMQLNDILLGCSMFAYKRNAGMVGEKLERQKGGVVSHLENGIGHNVDGNDFTQHKPAYFSIWNVRWSNS